MMMNQQDDRLSPQGWVRDASGPVISLGVAGSFDDTHLLSPCVAFEDGRYRMWYSGASGNLSDRAYKIGLAESTDGIHFTKDGRSPVLVGPTPTDSIVTPTLLRRADGSLLRENGKLRMWGIVVDFSSNEKVHTLRESTSADGVNWTAMSAVQMSGIYAPTIVHDGSGYRMWYTDITPENWCFRHADSKDGVRWSPDAEPCMVIDQPWEHERLFYPFVVRDGDTWLMWYGSYSVPDNSRTALGFAVSHDGHHWTKSPHNPMLDPDPSRTWESNYNTSETVLRMADGSWRIWYASRKQRPHTNKYFAIGTARWAGWGRS